MERLVQFLESDKYADVAPRIRESGHLGTFGWPMLQVLARRKKHWNFLTIAFLGQVMRRCAEVLARRFFPNWLARFFLKAFYNRR
jgi:hypothetical protein